jgi:hypothetical protein
MVAAPQTLPEPHARPGAAARSPAAQVRGGGISNAGVDLASVAAVAAALLVFVSGSFVIAQILDVKRPLEGILTAPVAIAAAYYWVNRPRRLWDPLLGFVLVKTVVEIALRGEWIWVLDDLATLLGLSVVLCAPARCVITGAKTLTTVAGVFAVMALVQFFWLLVSPDLDRFGFDDSATPGIDYTVRHLIAMLGMFTDEHYLFFGHIVHRLHSFATEPSLTVVYFLLPAVVGLLLPGRTWLILGLSALVFSLLSLAGSVFLCFGFAAVWWVLIRFLPLRFAMLYGLPVVLVGFLYGVKTAGFDALFQAISFVSRYGEFLNKSESLVSRAGGAVVTMDTAVTVPLGGEFHPVLPGPWLVNSAIEAGWLGVVFLVVFLGRVASQLVILNRNRAQFSRPRIAGLLLLGVLTTVTVFNDYQMSNYAGLVLLGFIYRLILVSNEARAVPVASVGGVR